MQRKGPLRGKIFARCILGRLLAALFGCMTRISCRSRLVSDARRRYAARKGRFSRPRPLRERMKRKSCHGSPPGNASRRYLATTGPPPKTHRGDILPLSDAGERISRAFCHRRAPENAPRRNIATTCPLGDAWRRYAATARCSRDMRQRYVAAACQSGIGALPR